MSTTVDLGVSGLEVRTGDHICALYRGAERDDILVPFLEAGLRTGDKCICVLDAARPESLLTLFDDPQVKERLTRRYPQVYLCVYDIERFSGEQLLDLLKTHPKVLLGAMVFDNPYYIEPDEFLALRQ